MQFYAHDIGFLRQKARRMRRAGCPAPGGWALAPS